MKLRFGATEVVLLTAGLVGLLEQEVVRVLLAKDPSTVMSGICFVFVLIGAGVSVGRNFKIGPVEVELKTDPPPGEKEETPSPPTQDEGGASQ